MIDKDQVLRVLFSVVQIINNQLRKDLQLDISAETLLIGDKSKLDSLGLINFILAVEQKIEEDFHITLVLTENEDLLYSTNGPFQTIGALANYITQEIGKKTWT